MSLFKPTFGSQLNRDHPLGRDWSGYWLLNEGSGDYAYDSSGKGNTGSLISNTGSGFADPPTSTSGWGAGAHGGALRFLNLPDNNYISTPATTSNLAAFTICVWGAWTDRALSCELVSGTTSTTNNFELYLNTAGGLCRPEFYVYSGALFPFRNTTVDIVDGKLHFIAGVFSPGAIDVYTDGVLANGTLTGTPPSVTNTDASVVYLGAYKGLSSFMLGSMTAAALIPRALSAAEIAYLHAFPYAAFDDESWWMGVPLAAYLPRPRTQFLGPILAQ